MNRLFSYLTLTICLFAALLLVPEVAFACPNCKDALAQNDPVRMGLVKGYFWSILFMMSMPFLILFSISTYFYLLVRRARAMASAAPQVVQSTVASHAS